MDATTQFALDQQLRPQLPPSTPAVPLLATTPAKPQLTIHHWSDRYLNKIPLHATFIFLHTTLYIYTTLSSSHTHPLSSLALSMHNLHLPPIDAVSTSTLLSSAALTGNGGGGSSSLSGRVVRMLGVHCMASVHVDEAEVAVVSGGMAVGGMGDDDVQTWIEQRVMQELKACKAKGMWVTSSAPIDV